MIKREKMKALVIYYSLSGNTQKVAEGIANTLKADINRLEDRQSRTGLFGMLRTMYQVLFSRPSKIRFARTDPYQYDLLVLGAPVWIMKLAPPMRSYIIKEKDRFNQVAFFCTEGASGALNAFKAMESLSTKKPVATLEITEGDIKSGQYHEKTHTFTDGCQKAMTSNSAVVAV
jgi:flavodoxin